MTSPGAATPAYQPLGRVPRIRPRHRYSSAWLGDDHILLVDHGACSERYRRFALRDIQAFAVEPTRMNTLWLSLGGILATAAVLFSLLALSDDDNRAVLFFFLLPLTGLGLWMFFRNLVRGATCKFYIVTAVSSLRADNISRLKEAQRALQKLDPLVRAAQAEIAEALQAARVRPPAAAGQPEDGAETAPPATAPDATAEPAGLQQN